MAKLNQAGDQTNVGGNTLNYDYEGHVVAETDGVSKAVEIYVYDGDGHRVEKYVQGGSARTVFVYDAQGLLAAEYSTTANSSPCLTCYLSPDQLGTARLVTDQNGNVVARHDYLPFGEEIAASTAGRDGSFGPGNDSVRQKFTGKERDSESGLDYFGARYYGSALGRFSSPDDGSDQAPVSAQSWNLYNYVRNGPLVGLDPSGRDCITLDNNQTADDGQGTPCPGSQTPQIINVPTQIPYDVGEQAFVGFVDLFFNGRLSGAQDLAVGLWELYPANLPFTLAGHSGQLAAALRSFGGRGVKELLEAAGKPGKGGLLTRAGHALQKHANRTGSVFPGAAGSEASWNEEGREILQRILEDPGATSNEAATGRYGNVIDIRDSTGKGARFSAETGEFVSFLEP